MTIALPIRERVSKMLVERHDACGGEGCDGCVEGLVPHEHVAKRSFSRDKRIQLAKEGKAVPVRQGGKIVNGRYPIETAGDLENAVHAFGRSGGDPSVKALIVRRAHALKRPDLIPGGWKKSSSVKKVETFSKPGTADVTPQDLKHLRPLLEYYRKKAHPFGACKRDQMKHGLSEDHANRRCAVIKDLIEGNTHWRHGGGGVHKAIDWRGRSKVVKSSGDWTPEVVEALDRVADCLDYDQVGKRRKRATGAMRRLVGAGGAHDC